MRVIEAGKLPPERDPWPVGLLIECPRCHGRFEIEASDLASGRTAHTGGPCPVSVVTERTPGGRSIATIQCPTPGCGTVISEDKPAGNWMPLYRDRHFASTVPGYVERDSGDARRGYLDPAWSDEGKRAQSHPADPSFRPRGMA